MPEHLGGYVPDGDPATWFPDLWTYMVERIGVRSILDIGAGNGRTMDFFIGLGCDVMGVEGTPQDHPFIIQHDYTHGPLTFDYRFDLCWCCEFVEHVEEQHIPNFMASMDACDLLLMTHAFPGQPGHHHVNCQPPEYWMAQLRPMFTVDWKLTSETTHLARKNTFTWTDDEGTHVNHFLRSGTAYRHR